MAEIILVRHGKTAGNLEGRYIGSRTDEPLCEEGIHALEEKVREGTYPPVDLVYASPMIRCRQTAKILWPKFTDSSQIQYVQNLQECDFGAFENKNYQELSGNAEYQAWIDSNGTLPFPEASPMKHSGSGAARRFCVSQKDCRSRKRRQGRHFGQQW